MSEEREQEGWGVPMRPPLIAAAATLVGLVTVIVLFGRLYLTHIEPRTRAPLGVFPAPRLETLQTPPRERRPDFRQPSPRRIGAAMQATAAQGDALWGPARP